MAEYRPKSMIARNQSLFIHSNPPYTQNTMNNDETNITQPINIEMVSDNNVTENTSMVIKSYNRFKDMINKLNVYGSLLLVIVYIIKNILACFLIIELLIRYGQLFFGIYLFDNILFIGILIYTLALINYLTVKYKPIIIVLTIIHMCMIFYLVLNTHLKNDNIEMFKYLFYNHICDIILFILVNIKYLKYLVDCRKINMIN